MASSTVLTCLQGSLGCCTSATHLHPSPAAPLLPTSCLCSKPGTYAAGLRSTTCSLCPAGKQCPLTATAVPQTCGKGYFSNKDGARMCTPCPVNTYQDGSSPTQCTRW